jgi:hypothetical protein
MAMTVEGTILSAIVPRRPPTQFAVAALEATIQSVHDEQWEPSSRPRVKAMGL